MSSEKSLTEKKADALFIEADKYEEQGNFRKAFECFSAAARLGDVGCQVNLGNYYSSGSGVKRDVEKAAYWYKKAYHNGYSAGAVNLAIDRRNQGDIRSAVNWFKKAIAMKDGSAYLELAKIYMTRKGGHKAAAILLKQAMRLNKSQICEADREEVESLLREVGETRKQ